MDIFVKELKINVVIFSLSSNKLLALYSTKFLFYVHDIILVKLRWLKERT